MPRRTYYISTPIVHTFVINGANSFEGTTYSSFSCSFDGTSVSLSSCTWSVSGSNYVSISNGILTISQGANVDSITITATYNYQGTNYSATHSMTVTYPSVQHSLTIVGPENPDIVGETVQLSALFDGMALPSGASPTWEFRNYQGGNDTIDNSGLITIDQSNPETHPLNVWCIYNGYEAEININVLYQSGASSTTTTETIIDAQTGETTTTTTTFVDNGNGTSTTTIETTTTDSNGDITGTSRSETETQNDGSSTTTTTNYDANGTPTSGSNNTVDTHGNSNTQTLEYNNGVPYVNGYTIDTSNNPNGGETISNGLNTGVIVFDGHDWTATLTGKFPCSVLTQNNCPIIDCSYVESGKVNGVVILATPSYGGTHYNETNTSLSSSSSNYLMRFRINKWQNGSTTSDSIEFYHKQQTPYSSYRFGTRTSNVQLTFKLTCVSNIITAEIWYNNQVIAKPRYSRTYGFPSGLDGVIFELGKWTNNGGTDYYWEFEILNFEIVKTL